MHKYADPDTMFRGEIGKLGNIRFIETSEAKIWKDDTCPAGLAVFGTLVLGAHAYGVTEPNQFVEELGEYDHDRVKFLTCQDVEDEFAAARDILKELAAYAGQFERQPIPVSELVVGMKCGGSDGLYAGITANPTIGRSPVYDALLYYFLIITLTASN